jgi:diguanylate cyclase (GGDEF)-like protein
MLSFEVPYLLRNVTAVVCAVIDIDGYVKDCNKGFLYLANQTELPPHGYRVGELFLQPIFSDFLESEDKNSREPVYQGIINIGDSSMTCRSVFGSVFINNDCLFVIAEFDVSGMERLNAAVLNLNQEMAQLQRELVKKNNKLKRKEEKITTLMMTDPLTGIANRRSFDERIVEEISRHARYQQKFCLCLSDIDFFKSVNDTYGHDVGDLVIQRFAALLHDNKRDSDFVARIGGEEFAVILPNTCLNEGFVVIERVRELFANTSYEQVVVSPSASFGITEFVVGDTKDILIKRSDDALYKSKEGGRNRVMSV